MWSAAQGRLSKHTLASLLTAEAGVRFSEPVRQSRCNTPTSVAGERSVPRVWLFGGGRAVSAAALDAGMRVPQSLRRRLGETVRRCRQSRSLVEKDALRAAVS